MTAPSSDSAAIRQTIRALKAAGVQLLEVQDGEEDVNVETATEQEVIDAITAVDDAFLIVRLPAPKAAGVTQVGSPRTSHIRFVMGNDPEEVICDHGVSLSPILDPLTEGWWA